MAHFTIEIEIKEDDLSGEGNLKADRVFRCFQVASEGHVNSLGIGPDELIQRDLIWVLTKMKLIFRENITKPGKYLCTTYPVSQKRATFKRDYYINSITDGPDPDKALIIGASQWCILNYRTRKLEKTDIVFESADDEKDMIAGVFPKIRGNMPEFVAEHRVDSGDIDYNDHCNNTVYITLAEEVTGRKSIKELFVNFASETRLGDTFGIYAEEQEEATYIEGRRSEGAIVFQLITR